MNIKHEHVVNWFNIRKVVIFFIIWHSLHTFGCNKLETEQKQWAGWWPTANKRPTSFSTWYQRYFAEIYFSFWMCVQVPCIFTFFKTFSHLGQLLHTVINSSQLLHWQFLWSCSCTYLR